MKIAQVTTIHKTYDNRIFHKECKSLAQAGYDVYLLACISQKKVSNSDTEVKLIELTKHKNRKSHFIRTSIFQVIKEARKLKADVYHIHDPELLIAGLLLKLLGYKVVYDVHENNPAALLSKPYIKSQFKAKLISMIFDGFERFAASKLSAVVTATEDIAVRFNKLNPIVLRNFPIVPNLKTIPKACVPKNKKVVLFVGGLSVIRGIKELIAAFEKIEMAELWLLGPFESESFKQDCESIRGWENVRYLGVVPPDEIYSYIKIADLGVVTYLPFPNHVTALPTKPFEYMAGGLPMIMSHFKYWKEVFAEVAFFTDPSDSEIIASDIESALSETGKLEEIAKRSVQLIESEYSWQIESKRLISLYQKLEN